MRRLALLLSLAACTAPAPEPFWWRLTAIDGVPFAARARIAFVGDDRVIGEGPCNSFSARIEKLEFPRERVVDLVATERGCDDLSAEAAFFAALTEMTGRGVSLSALYFVNDAGRRLDFVPAAAAAPLPGG